MSDYDYSLNCQLSANSESEEPLRQGSDKAMALDLFSLPPSDCAGVKNSSMFDSMMNTGEYFSYLYLSKSSITSENNTKIYIYMLKPDIKIHFREKS